ncbi:outer membrane protein assembly factor BamD [Pontivivens insulae]|uniref:Outer membrane protein assembly factor BamD n=1 Tax=Pontivivens insulae TaxID=1639689 RepID=A0A2R8ADH3_9RHOB|nr:outer membrane protein assembly factor BamD [Pontivivens insulae]RED14211.1 Beta-barrel assembly machine subunit BamD [Pontivivens insulae]SPF30286.1 Outer membrane protein assembly factor BamD [Pontivivens insulae]
MMRLTRLPLILATTAMLSGCGWFSSEEEVDPILSMSAQQIFETAQTQLDEGSERTAARTFAEVERLHPYSQWAKRALIMSAFAYYEATDFEEARSSAQRFIDFYPADDEAAYAAYIIALTWYDQINDVGRDQGNTIEALQALQTVMSRYPGSEYARDADLKFDLALDHLAGKEMEIGRYYLARGHYTAAISRFKVVVDDFDTTSHTPEALHRLVESYMALGLDDEALKSASVLGYNFPGSDWYEDSYALITSGGLVNASEAESLLDRIYRQVILGEQL